MDRSVGEPGSEILQELPEGIGKTASRREALETRNLPELWSSALGCDAVGALLRSASRAAPRAPDRPGTRASEYRARTPPLRGIRAIQSVGTRPGIDDAGAGHHV